VIGTLAAAYAEAGQFANAVEAAHIAETLSSLTNRKDVATKYSKMRSLYEARMTPSTARLPDAAVYPATISRLTLSGLNFPFVFA